jgi:2-methylisocitrate lyase-like PEP mutase family enzyme
MNSPTSTEVSPASALRVLLEERSAVLAPGVFGGLSASLTNPTGFRAAYMSGAAAVAASATGPPDIGLATQTEANHVALLTGILGIPLVADADTGFGDVMHTFRAVQLYERAGAAGIQPEDQEFPKRCGHLDDKRLVPAAPDADICPLDADRVFAQLEASGQLAAASSED